MTQYRVRVTADDVSLNPNATWITVGNFTGNVDDAPNEKAYNYFAQPVVARYIRFEPLAWVGARPAMRADALVPRDP